MCGEGSWRLGPGARRRIVAAVKAGMSKKRAAARFCVSPATVNLWVHRELDAGDAERESGSWAEDRSSRPHRSPTMLSDEEHNRICEVREHTGWGPRLIAALVDRPHSTVHAALRRRGCSRRPKLPRETVVRYEWPCPGNLLHIDVKKFGRFQAPGHKVTGDRRQRSRRVGWDYVHSIVDDCSRLAYSEVHDDERAQTVTASQTTPGPTPTTARSASSCSSARSSTGRSVLTGPKQTARSSATSKRWHANGPTARPTPTQTPAAPRCHTGSSTTTSAGTTARSETGHRSRGFTRSSGRTARSASTCAAVEPLHRPRSR
jgi:transposase